MPAVPSEPPDPALRWFCPSCRSLLWEVWEDEHFVLNPRSGETHVLNALAGEILRALAERPHPVSELAERFGGDLAEESVAGKEQIVFALISQLDRLGLIEPMAP